MLLPPLAQSLRYLQCAFRSSLRKSTGCETITFVNSLRIIVSSMDAIGRATGANPRRKLKAACDQCHASKVKCPGGGPPCKRCEDSSQTCHYSLAARVGKPPGSKNKKSLERSRRYSGHSPASNAVQSSVRDTTMGGAEPDWPPERSLQGPEEESRSQEEFAALASLLQSSPKASGTAFADESGSPLNAAPVFSSAASNENSMQLENPSLLPSIDFSLPDRALAGDDASHFDSTWLEDSNWESLLSETPVLSSSNDTLSSSSAPLRGAPFQSNRPVSLSAVAAILDESSDSTDAIASVSSQQQPSCRCMRELTDTLCQLHSIEKRQNPVQVDTLLTCATFVLKTAENHLMCLQCRDDTRTQMQVIMIFQTIFSWAQMHVHGDGPCPDLSVTLGRHEMSKDEAAFVRFALVTRALERSVNAVRMITVRIDRLVASRQGRQTWSSELSELQNLQQLNRSLCQTSKMLLRRLAARKDREGIK
ncbi:hypothetical protein EV356DRAFT_121160 [Viridothelium virens]|uniref:Zn(2)-C6 fungal-type domain-containing protein n=1 Tax=Viridothelium virens TaxID=1048519 RepID=A0A6A6HCL1_VIRVR|nr:hypothetical protein EV356DRAFT_121160 [Viridothelium virens]